MTKLGNVFSVAAASALFAFAACSADEDAPIGAADASTDGRSNDASAIVADSALSPADSAIPPADYVQVIPDAATAPDSGREASCSSPVALPPPDTDQRLIVGCPCDNRDPSDYCLNGYSVNCRGSWTYLSDGYCAPSPYPDPVGSCELLRGHLVASGTTCSSGYARRGAYRGPDPLDAGHESGDCCYPIEVSRDNCRAANLTVVSVGSDAGALSSCAVSRQLRAFIANTGLSMACCY